MFLSDLLEQIPYTCLQGDAHTSIHELVYHSGCITKDCVFVCIEGAKSDGHDYVLEAAKKGAKAVVVSRKQNYPANLTVILVENTRQALAYMSAAYFDYPANKLITIGVTGTKGKTTTTYIIKSILDQTGLKTGLIGTIEILIGDQWMPAGNTTPESYIIQETFAKMVKEGCQCVVMEASSQGLMLHRLDGFVFDYGIFTNIEPDHIGKNEHKDFAEYLRCKSKLLKQCKVGIINRDDSHWREILQGHTCDVETFGFSKEADLRAEDDTLTEGAGYLGVAYHVRGLMDFDVNIPFPGKFSVYNSLCAIALCRHFEVSYDMIRDALMKVRVRGRVEMIPISDQYKLIIDYAHNAMSLQSLLTTLLEYQPKRLICMFGCGGNRAKGRRYEMGEVSSRLADLTVVTSDNPRDEDPQEIINDIIIGVKKGPGTYIEIIDRKEAIRYCIEQAKAGDLIVLAGKGHEDYQEIQGKKYHMDERELIQEILAGK